MSMQARLLIERKEDRHAVCLFEGNTTVGSSAAADVRIAHPSLSPIHFRLVRENRGWLVTDAGWPPYGLEVNGQRVECSCLSPGDTIRVGEISMVFELIGQDGSSAETELIALDFLKSERGLQVGSSSSSRRTSEASSGPSMGGSGKSLTVSNKPEEKVEEAQRSTMAPVVPAVTKQGTLLQGEKGEHLGVMEGLGLGAMGIAAMGMGAMGIGASLMPERIEMVAVNVQPTELRYWAPESIQVPAACADRSACIRKGHQAVERTQQLIDNRLVSGENLFAALQVSSQGLASLRKVGATQSKRYQKLITLRRQVEKLLIRAVEDRKFDYQRALRLGDYDSADKVADGLKMLFPNRQDYGYLLAEKWKKWVEHCRRAVGTADKCS